MLRNDSSHASVLSNTMSKSPMDILFDFTVAFFFGAETTS
jgi:hypothetical protein